MKIGLVGYEANVAHRVGSNQYAYELLKAIHKQDNVNDFFVFLPTQPLPDMPKPKANWRYLVVEPRRLWNIFGLPRALYRQRHQLDLVFNPGHYSPLFCPCPLVVSIMDLGYLRFPDQFTWPIFLKLKFWTSFSLKKASHIFAISESTKQDIIFRYGVVNSKISVTYPGHQQNSNNQISNIQKIKNKYKISGDYLLFLSTLKPNKNIEGLLEAFKIVLKSNPGLSLVIAGRKGWLFENIFAKVRQLNLENKIIFTGFVDEIDKPALMNHAAVFVLPSFWEGFGVPVVEAMAYGTPVVVSNAGSLPEIVGRAGIIVDPHRPADIAAGIVKALKNKQKLAKLCKIQASKFSWEKCARETLAVFHRLART